MGMFDRKVLITEGGSMMLPSQTEGLGEGLGSLIGGVMQHNKNKKAQESISSSDAPDWMKKAAANMPADEAMKMFTEYKSHQEEAAASAAREDKRSQTAYDRETTNLILKSNMEHTSRLDEINQQSTTRIAELEAESNFMKDRLQKASDLSRTEHSQSNIEEMNMYKAKIAANAKAMRDEANATADRIDNFGQMWGLTNSAQRKGFSNGIRAFGNAKDFALSIQALHSVFPSANAGGIAGQQNFYKSYGIDPSGQAPAPTGQPQQFPQQAQPQVNKPKNIFGFGG